MRTLHTLKGGARLAGAMRLGEMAHRLETRIERLTAIDAPAAKAEDVEALQAVSDAMTNLPLPPWAIMVIINLTLLVLGTFMDAGSMIVIVIPIFLKTIIGLGYDPVWFGIVVTIQSEIAAISPPVGFNLFVLKSVVPGVNLNEVSNGAMIFVIPMLGAIAVLTMFPEIALFLPRLLLSNQ